MIRLIRGSVWPLGREINWEPGLYVALTTSKNAVIPPTQIIPKTKENY